MFINVLLLRVKIILNIDLLHGKKYSLKIFLDENKSCDSHRMSQAKNKILKSKDYKFSFDS